MVFTSLQQNQEATKSLKRNNDSTACKYLKNRQKFVGF
jgi:hypothetical protein